MRLHRMRLQSYRGVADATVEFATDGVTVVEGPNEVGKSSIPEALDLILNELDSSGKRSVREVRPVHLDAGPEVEVEISTGEYQFTYRKRWHKRPETTLAITAPKPEQLTGREAHERVEQILNDTTDKSLRDALHVEQGSRPGVPANLADATSLGQALDQAAGGNLASEQDDHLWGRIEAERLHYWTATGRVERERAKLASELDAATGRVAELESQIDAVEEDAAQMARLAAEEPRLKEVSEQKRAEEQELNKELKAANLLKNNVDKHQAELTAATSQLDRAKGDAEGRQQLISTVDERSAELAELEAEAGEAAPALDHATQQDEAAAKALGAAKEELRAAEAASRRANDDRDHHRQRIEIEQLSERYDRVLEAEKQLNAAEQVLAQLPGIDDDALARIEQASEAVIAANAAASTEVASLEVTALKGVDAQLDGERRHLAGGEQLSTDVRERTELVLGDVAKLVVQAGAGSRHSQAELDKARDELGSLCAATGVEDLASARQALQDRRDAQRDHDDAKRIVADNLRDLTPDVLKSKVEGLRQRVDGYSAQRPGDVSLPASFDEAKQVASEAERALESCRSALDTREEAALRAAEARKSADMSNATLGGKIENAREALDQANRTLDEARQQRPDQDLDAVVAAAEQSTEAAQQALDSSEAELRAADLDTIDAKLDNARDAASRAERELRENEARRQELKGRLEAQGAEGLHDQLNDAQSGLEHLQRNHDSTESRARAAELLYETFGRHRQQAHQRYIEPLKKQIERLGRIVYGPDFEVHINPELEVTQRTWDGKTLDMGQLSVGAREQLGVLCRLACAMLVSPDGGGAPVIIDDALGWSDPERLQDMGAAINSAGQDCQVIVLTCMPGRYSHIGNATTVKLTP